MNEFAARCEQAWSAFEEGRLEESDRAWERLVASAPGDRERDDCLRRHAYVLVALHRFDEARAIYRSLFERSGGHRDLHQLGMVEREAGNLAEALEIFAREAGLLPPCDALAEGANLYERALMLHRLGREREALDLLARCLAAARESGDETMRGAARRLEGDLLAARDAPRARDAYLAAARHFRQAGDDRGAKEVRERLASLRPLP